MREFLMHPNSKVLSATILRIIDYHNLMRFPNYIEAVQGGFQALAPLVSFYDPDRLAPVITIRLTSNVQRKSQVIRFPSYVEKTTVESTMYSHRYSSRNWDARPLSVHVRASDGSEATFQRPAEFAPELHDDTYHLISSDSEPWHISTSASGGSAQNGVGANDFIPTDVSVQLLVRPQHGSISIRGDGQFEYRANDTFEGTDSFVYQVCEGTQYFQTAVVTLVGNNRPRFVSSPIESAISGVGYQYEAKATDPENDAIHFELVSGPANLTVSASTGIVNWSPSNNDLGTNHVVLKVLDSWGNTSTQVFNIYVRDFTNSEPQFTSHPTWMYMSETPFQYISTATDNDGDSLTFSGNIIWPTGFTPTESQDFYFQYVNQGVNQRGIFTWNSPAELADREIVLEEFVTDSFHQPTRRVTTIAVHHEVHNQAPVITSQPATNYQVPLVPVGVENPSPVAPDFLSLKLSEGKKSK